MSYGVSLYGYDCRVGNEFKVFTNVYNTVVDPKRFDLLLFVDIKADCCIVPPNSFALASTVEYFRIPSRRPDRLPRQVHLRSLRHHRQRHAVRAGMEGHVTIEISNTTPLPAKIYANEGIAQVLFFQSDEPWRFRTKTKKANIRPNVGLRSRKSESLNG